MSYRNIVEVFTDLSSPKMSSKTFLQIEGEKHSYKDLLSKVRKMSTLYQQGGLREGDRIIVAVENDYDTTVFFMSLLRYGLTAVLIDPEASARRANAIIAKAAVSGYILQEKLWVKWKIDTVECFGLMVKKKKKKKGKIFRKLLKNRSSVHPLDQSSYPGVLENTEPLKRMPATVSADTLAYILFTSGTTSSPKGVMISHHNLCSHLATLARVYQMNESARILNNLLLYHADGIIQGPVLAAYTGGTVIRPLDKLSIDQIVELFTAIYKYRVTHFIVVPTILNLMNRFSEGYEDSFDTSDFAFIISVSAHIEQHLWEGFEQKFKTRIVNVYGLTETVAGSFFCGPGDSYYQKGTIGKAFDCEAKIIREDKSEAEIGEEGELILKGEHITSGYFNNQIATEASIRDNWLYTGDIAVRDQNDFFRIAGRKKNMIMVGGINIHAEEITETVNQHPDILESACLGLEDELFGEKLVCCAVRNKGSKLHEFMLNEFLHAQLESVKVPSEIFFLEQLPKGLSGKVQLDELKRIIEMESTASTTTSEQCKDMVLTAASQAFKVAKKELRMDDNTQSLEGWDSMAHLFFITHLEKIAGIRISTAEVLVIKSLQDAHSVLSKKTQHAS